MKPKLRNVLATCAAALAMLVVVTPLAQASTALKTKRGGSVVVSVGGGVAWPNLDPATVGSAIGLNGNLMNAIYGQLFEQGPHGTFVPDLASGYSYADKNLELVLTIRHGVTFQDGTPFTASAVAANINRVLEPQFACPCATNLADITSVTSSGKYTVEIHVSQPNASLMEDFVESAPDYVPSPTALASEPEATFSQDPVGAGPFQVVSNVASSQLVLKRFPHYWNAPEPYLNSLTFIAESVDQSAISALESGETQVALGVTTASIVLGAKSQFHVEEIPGVYSDALRLNTLKPPFNNILAREAVYYATNAPQIAQVVAPGFSTVVQEVDGPGDAYYQKTVPGFRTYNLAKAQALVQQLGGLTVTLLGANVPVIETLLAAVYQEWEAAGINVTLQEVPVAQVTAMTTAGTWQVRTASDGSIDPDVGSIGLVQSFYSGAVSSGVNDPKLDGLLNQSQLFVNTTTRQRVFNEIYKYMSDQAYSVSLFASPAAAIVARSLVGTSVTAAPANDTMNFEGVSYK